MKNITQANLSDAVKSSFEPIDNPRMRLLVNRLVHHLHAYAQDTQLTHAEWREGIAFLHRAASITTPSRSEFTLISDVLGLSSLVDLLASQPGATEGSVLGPFHTRGSPWMQSGANLINGNAGAAVVVRGRVTDIDGQPLPGARQLPGRGLAGQAGTVGLENGLTPSPSSTNRKTDFPRTTCHPRPTC